MLLPDSLTLLGRYRNILQIPVLLNYFPSQPGGEQRLQRVQGQRGEGGEQRVLSAPSLQEGRHPALRSRVSRVFSVQFNSIPSL